MCRPRSLSHGPNLDRVSSLYSLLYTIPYREVLDIRSLCPEPNPDDEKTPYSPPPGLLLHVMYVSPDRQSALTVMYVSHDPQSALTVMYVSHDPQSALTVMYVSPDPQSALLVVLCTDALVAGSALLHTVTHCPYCVRPSSTMITQESDAGGQCGPASVSPGAFDGGPKCRMSILRNDNIPCHYLCI